MRRIFILLVLALLAVDAAAQQYPERRQVRKGNRAYEKGNYQDAAGRYMRALGADPSSFEAQYNLGNALHRQEMYDQAAQVQQQAAADSLAAPVDRAQAFYNLGNTQFRQQKYAEALESYKNSLRLNPDDPQAKFNYAYTKKLLDRDQNSSTIRTSRIRTTKTTRTIKITRTIKTRTSRTAKTSRIRRRARTIRRRVTGKATTSSRTAGPTRSRRARADPSRPAFRLPNRSGCSTPSRRRRTGRRRSSKRRPAPWYG